MENDKNKKRNAINQEVLADYNIFMHGFDDSPLLHSEPMFLHGNYIQLSAYENKDYGQAVTAEGISKSKN